MKHRIEELARKLAIEDKVTCIEVVPHSKMPEYLASVDIFVDTFVNISNNKVISKGNGIGIIVLEAMACATPQIIADRIEVRSGELYQGLTYRPLDYQDLANKIIELSQNEKLRERIKKESRDLAMQIGEKNIVMKKWEDLYRKLLSTR
jgi:glycosyltransferase involved in cell wall biosynthesis